MNTINYILHYLLAYAYVRFEESYWWQVFYNDLWIKILNNSRRTFND